MILFDDEDIKEASNNLVCYYHFINEKVKKDDNYKYKWILETKDNEDNKDIYLPYFLNLIDLFYIDDIFHIGNGCEDDKYNLFLYDMISFVITLVKLYRNRKFYD